MSTRPKAGNLCSLIRCARQLVFGNWRHVGRLMSACIFQISTISSVSVRPAMRVESQRHFFCFGARLKCDNLIKPRSDEHLENRTWDGTINIPFFSSLLWRIFIDPYAKSYARAAAACCFQRSANDFEEFLYLPFVYLRPT